MDRISKARNKTLILKVNNRATKITQDRMVYNKMVEANKTLRTS